MRKAPLILLSLLLLAALALVACEDEEAAQEDPDVNATIRANPTVPPPAAGTTIDAITGTAFVENIDVMVPGAEADEVQVVVQGNLNDQCTHIEEVAVSDIEGTTFQVSIRTWRETDAICAQVLVPFEESFTLDVAGLTPGTYTVEVNGESETFTLPEQTEPEETPSPAPALALSSGSVVPGGALEVSGRGFPANSTIELGTGPQNSEYEIIATATTDDGGNVAETVTIPDYAEAGELWVLVADWDGNTVVSEPFAVVAPPTPEEPAATAQPTPTSADSGVNVPVNGLFTRTQIYLIALEDAGQAGEEIGCGDSVVPVAVEIEPTVAPLRAALERLLAIDSEFYGQSGLYNALYQSDLQVQGIDIVNREAIINLTGNLALGGTCDNPRVDAQLRQTALQFSTVDAVTIRINGTPLPELLSGQ